MIQAHNIEKSELMTELRALRNAMSPAALQALNAAKKTNEQKVHLEDELIRANIARDNAQVSKKILFLFCIMLEIRANLSEHKHR